MYIFVCAPNCYRFAIPISSGIFSGSTDMNAAIAVGSPITTVTGVGMTSKDVQPKSPGVNDEDDDEGRYYFFQVRIIVI